MSPGLYRRRLRPGRGAGAPVSSGARWDVSGLLAGPRSRYRM